MEQAKVAKDKFKKLVVGTEIEKNMNGIGITEVDGKLALKVNLENKTQGFILEVDDFKVIYDVVGKISAQ